jgi:carbonic anhydrase
MGALKCRACVVFCIDFRLHVHLNRFVAERGLDRDGAYILRVAGVALNLARPKESGARDFVTGQLDASRRLHEISEIHLVNHEDCGAYGLEGEKHSGEELATHAKDMREARAFLKGRFPGTKIHVYFQHLDGRVEEID